MKASEFSRRSAAQAEAAGEAFRQEVGAIMTKAAAEGSLHSGGTIKKWARAAGEHAQTLTVGLLNDYEAIKRRAHDRELMEMAYGVAIGFAESLQARCPLDRIKGSDGAKKATDRLFEGVVATTREMTTRHAAGLPLEGVNRRDPPAGPAVLGAYERWVKANPALSSLITFLLGFAVAIAGILVKLSAPS